MNESITLSTPDQIAFARLATLKGALKLECFGMRRKGPSAYSIAKKEYGLKGNKEKVLDQLEKMVKERL